MKILLIGPFSPPLSGVSIANDNLFDALGKSNEVSAINFSYDTIKEDIGKFSLKKMMASIGIYRHLKKIRCSDFIYMTPGQTFLGVMKYAPFILYAKYFKKGTIVHVHGNYMAQEYRQLKGLKKVMYRRLLSGFDHGIVLSPNLKGNLSQFLPSERIHVVYNFVADEILDAIGLEEIKNKSTSALRILYLSNLMKQKGILDLLESLYILKAKGIPFQAVLAGAIDTETEKEVEKYLRALKDEVDYRGVISGREKIRALLESNVFVFPTYYDMEGQPIAILEAMAAGNIIVTTEHAGIPDIFEPGINGMYVQKKNAENLANELIEIGRNLPKLKSLMVNNHEEAKGNYSLKRFSDGVENVIRKCKI